MLTNLLPIRMMSAMAKILPIASVRSALSPTKKIVFATGVFDLPHPGHWHFLTCAREAGDILVVGVESDEMAKAAKGPDRPLLTQEERLAAVASFHAVDIVVSLPPVRERNAYQRICSMIGASVLAVTSDDPYLLVKTSMMRAIGGEVRIVTERIFPFSTSLRIAEIDSRPAHA